MKKKALIYGNMIALTLIHFDFDELSYRKIETLFEF